MNEIFFRRLSSRLDDILEFAFGQFKKFAPEDPLVQTPEGQRLLQAANYPKAGVRLKRYGPIVERKKWTPGGWATEHVRMPVYSEAWKAKRREAFDIAEATNLVPDVEKMRAAEKKVAVESARTGVLKEILTPKKRTAKQARGEIEVSTEKKIGNVRGYAADILGQRRRIIHGYAAHHGIPLQRAYREIRPEDMPIYAHRLNIARQGQGSKAEEKFSTFKEALIGRLSKGAEKYYPQSPMGQKSTVENMMKEMALGPAVIHSQQTRRRLGDLLKWGSARKGDRKFWRGAARRTAEQWQGLEEAASTTPKAVAGVEKRIIRREPSIYQGIEALREYKKPPVNPGFKRTGALALGLLGGVGAGVGIYAYRKRQKQKQLEQKMSSRLRLIEFASKKKLTGALTPSQVKKMAKGLQEAMQRSQAGGLLQKKIRGQGEGKMVKGKWVSGIGGEAGNVGGATPRAGWTTEDERIARMERQAAETGKDILERPKKVDVEATLKQQRRRRGLVKPATMEVIGADKPAPSTKPPGGVRVEGPEGERWWTPTTVTERILGQEKGTQWKKGEAFVEAPGFPVTKEAAPYKVVTSRHPPGGKTEGAAVTDVGTLRPGARAEEISAAQSSPPGSATGEMRYTGKIPSTAGIRGPSRPGQSVPAGVAQKERAGPNRARALERLKKIYQKQAASKVQAHLSQNLQEQHTLRQELEEAKAEMQRLGKIDEQSYNKGLMEGHETGKTAGYLTGMGLGEERGRKLGHEAGHAERVALQNLLHSERVANVARLKAEVRRRRGSRKGHVTAAFIGAGAGGAAGAGAAWYVKPERRQRELHSRLREIHFALGPRATRAAAYGTYGGIAGVFTGYVGGSIAGHGPRKRLHEELQSGRGVDSRSYLNRQGVRYIGSDRDIRPGDFHPIKEHLIRGFVRHAQAGKNAYAGYTDRGQPFVITRPRAPKQVLAHEAGHIRDFNLHGHPKWHEAGIPGAVGGGTLRREKAAWELTDVEQNDPVRTSALKTYSRVQTGTRLGLAGGIGAGVWYGLRGHKKRGPGGPPPVESASMPMRPRRDWVPPGSFGPDLPHYPGLRPLRRLSSRLREIRFAEQKRTTAHDIATGALEGGLVGPFTEPIFAKLQGKKPKSIFKGGIKGFGKRALIGAGLGAVTTGLVGAGVSAVNKLYRQKKLEDKFSHLRVQYPSSGFRSKSRLIRFAARRFPVMSDQEIAPVDRQRGTGSPIRVVKDRYSKEIVNRERNRRDANYARTALVGGVLGAQFHKRLKLPVGRSVVGGAVAGFVTQGLVRNLVTKHQRDVFGEKTIAAKREDLAPWVGGAVASGGVSAYRAYQTKPWLRRAVHRYFKARGKEIHFQDATGDYTPEQRKAIDRMIYGRRRKTFPIAKKYTSYIRRGKGFAESAREAAQERATGQPTLDVKGRPKKKEWQKRWFKTALLTAGIGGAIFAGHQTLRSFAKAPAGSGRRKLAEAWGNKEQRGKAMREMIPGYKPTARFFKGVREEIGYKIDPAVGKVAKAIGSPEDEATKRAARGQSRERLLRRLKDIMGGSWRPPAPGSTTEEVLSSRLKLIQFAQDVRDWRVSDPRGRSARVFYPGHQKRDRPEMPGWRKKGTLQAVLAGTVTAIPVAVWGGRKLGARSSAKLAVRKTLKAVKKSEAPVEKVVQETDPYILQKQAEEQWRERQRIIRGEEPKKMSSKLKLIRFAEKRNGHPIETSTIVGGSSLGGAVLGSQIIGGRRLKPGESLVGKRVVRRHARLPLAYHEALGIGGGKVAEVHSARAFGGMGEVRIRSVEDFAKGRVVRVLDKHRNRRAAEEAMGRVGQKWPYNILTSNCSDFSDVCRGRRMRLVPSRQWRRAAGGAAIGAGVGLGGAYLIKKAQERQGNRQIAFKAKEERQPIFTKRNVTIGAGLGAAGLGVSTLAGARPFMRIAARNWGSRGKGLELTKNAPGHFVSDYLEGSRKGLGGAPQGWAVRPFLRRAQAKPKGIAGRIISARIFNPEKLPADFAASHMAKFERGGLEGLDHWNYEMTEQWAHDARTTSAAKPHLAESQAKKLKGRLDENHYGREKGMKAIKHLMDFGGLNEHDAIRQVATHGMAHTETGLVKNHPEVQKWFFNLAQQKAKAATGYAKKGLVSPGLMVVGGTTAGTAAFVGGDRKASSNGRGY